MKIATIFASALAFSTVAPTFAHAAYLQNTDQVRTTGKSAQHVAAKRARAMDSMAYAPANFGDNYTRDFGIGSQH